MAELTRRRTGIPSKGNGLKPKSSGRIPSGRFAKGDKVEVQSDKDGFLGAWFPAIIIDVFPFNNGYKVRYDPPVSKGDRYRPPEIIHFLNARPRPQPPYAHRRYIHNEIVNVYIDHGWWLGVVSKSGNSLSKYNVCFPISRMTGKFDPSQMRTHFEWNNIEWLPSVLEGPFTVDQEVEVACDFENSRNFDDIWYKGTTTRVIDKATFKVKYKKLEVEWHTEIVDLRYIRPNPPQTRLGKDYAVHEHVELWHCFGWMEAVVTEKQNRSNYVVQLKYKSNVNIKITSEGMRPHRRWINSRWR